MYKETYSPPGTSPDFPHSSGPSNDDNIEPILAQTNQEEMIKLDNLIARTEKALERTASIKVSDLEKLQEKLENLKSLQSEINKLRSEVVSPANSNLKIKLTVKLTARITSRLAEIENAIASLQPTTRKKPELRLVA